MVSATGFAHAVAHYTILGDFEQVSYEVIPDPPELEDREYDRFKNKASEEVTWYWFIIVPSHFTVTGLDDETEPWVSAPWSSLFTSIVNNEWDASKDGTIDVPAGWWMVYHALLDVRAGHETLKHIPSTVQRTRNLSMFVADDLWAEIEEPQAPPGPPGP